MGSGIIHNLIVEYIGEDYLFWSFYVLNVLFGIISYKLGFARELPLLKSVIVYVLLIVGMFVITIFNILGLPITESFIIIALVLAVYRFRLHRERQAKEE